MKSNNERVCPFCAETIKVAAKVCPRCRQCLSIWSFRHPVTGVVALGLPMFTVLGFFLFAVLARFERLSHPKPDYTEVLGSLKIIESRMNWVPTTNGIRIYLVGTLTNQSPYAWRDVEFDCRFFDTNGSLVDAAPSRTSFVIEPNCESAFRVSIIPARSTNDYASYKMSVSTARNPRSWY